MKKLGESHQHCNRHLPSNLTVLSLFVSLKIFEELYMYKVFITLCLLMVNAIFSGRDPARVPIEIHTYIDCIMKGLIR